MVDYGPTLPSYPRSKGGTEGESTVRSAYLFLLGVVLGPGWGWNRLSGLSERERESRDPEEDADACW